MEYQDQLLFMGQFCILLAKDGTVYLCRGVVMSRRTPDNDPSVPEHVRQTLFDIRRELVATVDLSFEQTLEELGSAPSEARKVGIKRRLISLADEPEVRAYYLASSTRVLEDFSSFMRPQGDELREDDVGRTLTLYMNKEREVTSEDVGRRVYHRGILQLEGVEQRDVRKNLLPPGTIVRAVYCSGCAAMGDDPECECGGHGWVTFDAGFGPCPEGTFAENDAQAKIWAEEGI